MSVLFNTVYVVSLLGDLCNKWKIIILVFYENNRIRCYSVKLFVFMLVYGECKNEQKVTLSQIFQLKCLIFHTFQEKFTQVICHPSLQVIEISNE